MKKIFWIFFLVLVLVPVLASAQAPLVQCGNNINDPCTICDFFDTIARIYNFLVLKIATPLAVVSITIGAIILMISAGNAQMVGLGKKILWVSIIGLVLVFCSWLIINTILELFGFQLGTWWNPNLKC